MESLCLPKCQGGLGFKEIGSFNKALVAKQGWRIIQSPDSLMAKVVKEKDFHEGTFLDAHLGSCPPYLWRSLIWSRDLLVKGLR